MRAIGGVARPPVEDDGALVPGVLLLVRAPYCLRRFTNQRRKIRLATAEVIEGAGLAREVIDRRGSGEERGERSLLPRFAGSHHHEAGAGFPAMATVARVG